MSYKAVLWVRSLPNLSAGEKSVFLCLASCAHPVTGIAWPSQIRLAAWSGVTATYVSVVLKKLCYLKLIRRAAPPARVRTNAYQVLVPRKFASEWDEGGEQC